jgi:branched-chain amino acid transport system ATP-binding protein
MLELAAINAYYGQSQALFKFSLSLAEGQVTCLLGRNGMGKSTTIKAIMGLLPIRSGRINFLGSRINGLPPYAIARLGMGYVPEGREIFPTLSVRENLLVAAANPRKLDTPYTMGDIFTIFPRLEDRIEHFGSQLSGGEQQMLAVGRALMTNPRLLLLDEATEGLAPLIRKEIWRGLQILKEKGLAILIVDKNLKDLMAIADRHFIVERGAVVWSGTTAELGHDREIQARYLGV